MSSFNSKARLTQDKTKATPLMKTIKPPTASKPISLFQIRSLTLAAALIVPAATGFSQTLWTNVTGDYNVASSWSPNVVPTGTVNCTDDNGSNNVILIQAGDPVFQHGDTLAGNAANTSGAWLQTGSTNNTGGGNWLRLGLATGSFGSYVLSNGVVNVGGQTHLGEFGTGYLEIDGGTFNTSVTGQNPGLAAGDANDFGDGSVGTFVMTGGAFNNPLETWIGTGNAGRIGTGHFVMHGGTINANNWFVLGRFGGQADGIMDGGTLNKNNNGNLQLAVGNQGSIGAVVTFTQNGGTINCQGQYQISTDSGLAVCTNNIGGTAVLNVDNWLAVGRNAAKGVLNISGNAAISMSGINGGNLTIGSGGASVGIINQSGGAVTNTATQTYIGESGTSSGTWNLTNGTAILGTVYLANANTASGVLTLEGGKFRANSISSPTFSAGTTTVLDLNGGTLQAGANNANFVSSLYLALVDAGGAVIDSQGFNIGIPQVLTDFGAGNALTKLGSGTLTLTGANSYSGNTTISGGTILTTTASTTPGSVTLADGTGFGVTVLSAGAQYGASSLTLGTSVGTTLSFAMGNFGNPGLTGAPINLSGTLSKNGVTTVNVTDGVPQVGQFPLIKYSTLAGTGSFVIGSLPTGVIALIVTNTVNGSIDLAITSVNQPRWDGQAGATWDTLSDTNWVNIGTGLPTAYSDPSTVLFDDEALGNTTVSLAGTVNPINVTVTNNTLPYAIVGAGKIGGSTGINKQGTSTLALLNTGGNTFTGPVTISGGTLSVTNLPNDGVAGPIGKGSLVLAGGNFTYAGPATSVSHSYTTTANGSTLTTVNNLTLTGGTFAAGVGGGLNKSGLATLTYAQSGSNVLSDGASGGFEVLDGSVTFDGSNGGQTNMIGSILALNGQNSVARVLVTNSVVNTGDLGLGNLGNSTNVLTIDGNSTVNMGGWLIFGDGGNAVTTLTLNHGTFNVNNGKVLMGGRPGDTSTLNINGGFFNNAGGQAFDIADGNWNGPGARTATVNQSGGTNNCNNSMSIGNAATATGFYNLTNGELDVSGEIDVGNGGAVGTFNIFGGTLNINSWFVTGRAGSVGCALNLSGGTINKNNNGAFIIASGAGNNGIVNSGTFNISGGTVNSAGEFWIAENNLTTGTNNISGTASMNIHNWVTVGRGGLGVVNMTGGQFNSDTQPLVVGIYGGGTGIWNQSSGSVSVNQDIWIGQGDPNANGTINLNGGTITNTTWLAVGRQGGNGVFNINGGTYVRSGAGGGAGGPNVSVSSGSGSGMVNVNSGLVDVSAGDNWIGEVAAGTWNQNGGTAINSYVQLGRNGGATGNLSLNGGVFAASQIAPGGGASTINFNGGTLKATASNANFLSGLGTANVMAGGAVINCAGNAITIGQSLLNGGGGLTNVGSGTLYLNGANTYLGQTTVSAGTLGGVGTLASAVSVASGAALAPGTAAATGTMTINSNLTLAAGSSTSVKISLDGGANNDQVAGLTSVTYAGTLVVTNIGAASLASGGSFHLFNAVAHSGNFSNAGSVTILPSGTGTFDPATGILTVAGVVINAPTLSGGKLTMTGSGAPGANYTWLSTTNLTTPVALWVTNSQGLFSAGGTCTNIYTVTNPPAQFFRLRTP